MLAMAQGETRKDDTLSQGEWCRLDVIVHKGVDNTIAEMINGSKLYSISSIGGHQVERRGNDDIYTLLVVNR